MLGTRLDQDEFWRRMTVNGTGRKGDLPTCYLVGLHTFCLQESWKAASARSFANAGSSAPELDHSIFGERKSLQRAQQFYEVATLR